MALAPISKYGLQWSGAQHPLSIEMAMIRAGGYKTIGGTKYGEGLFHHYRAMQQCLWPEEDHHRWSDLILKEFLENRITIVQGPKDSGKTHCWARIALTDYWTFPFDTLWIISSTDLRGLELRVWGDIKDLYNRAKERFEYLEGHCLESKHGIFTYEIGEEGRARDIRCGLLCVPCIGGNGEWAGIEKFCGIKQKRRRLIGDELQFMKAPYLQSIEHLDKGDFKMGGAGNTIGQGDPLDKLAEPAGGWGTEPQSDKTEVWKNKFGGVTINLDGRDTPNRDNAEKNYNYLINESDLERTRTRYGEDSGTYWTQCIGKRKSGLLINRILTREQCIRFGAFESPVWAGGAHTKIYAQDAAFGGDRAIHGHIEFGEDVSGKWIIQVHAPDEIPIKVNKKEGQGPTPEEQLAAAAKVYCQTHVIPFRNVFFDAGMRASLATEMARAMSVETNAVNFGGSATTRPVSFDEYIWDDKLKQKRLKRCDEMYSKFVTELWGTVRLIVLYSQMKTLPEEVAQEFFMREWKQVRGDRWEIETKDDMKLRVGYSPDYADWLAIACEGARRLGFRILKDAGEEDPTDRRWIGDLRRRGEDSRRRHELTYS